MHGLVLREYGRRLDLHAVVRVPAAEHLALGRLGIRRERDTPFVVRVAVRDCAVIVKNDLVDGQMGGIRKDGVADAVAAPDAAVRSRAIRGVEDPGEAVALHVGRMHSRIRGDRRKTGQDIGIVVAVGDRASRIGIDNPGSCAICYAEAVG